MIGLDPPLFDGLGVPSEVLPLALLRPITGAGSLAYPTDLIETYGPDSLIGRIASTIQGSTDTTLYVLTVYFGAVGIRRTQVRAEGRACFPTWSVFSPPSPFACSFSARSLHIPEALSSAMPSRRKRAAGLLRFRRNSRLDDGLSFACRFRV